MAAHAWSPETYLAFSAPRLRPALDLIDAVARIDGFAPRSIVDLGCGPGGITRRLARRWPDAGVLGIDGDAAMLERASAGQDGEAAARVAFEQGDIGAWARAAGPAVDLVYSNAALHWLDDHGTLFAGLARRLSPGGVLAVQMPLNFDRPSHTAISDLLAARWPDVAATFRLRRLAPQEDYVAWLEAAGCVVDTWKTDYLHILSGPDPVVAWTSGSALGPVFAALPQAEHAAFREAYAARLRTAYPPLDDGRTLFPFLRLFLLARRTA